MTEEEFEKNREVFEWLTAEADKRGIWVVLKFYSIHIPLPFAQAHHLELLQSSIRLWQIIHINPLWSSSRASRISA